jgi:hypothetical protein
MVVSLKFLEQGAWIRVLGLHCFLTRCGRVGCWADAEVGCVGAGGPQGSS